MAQKIKISGAAYILRILELLDAEHLFAYPGGAILPIYDALPFSKLCSTLVRHEQAASLAANAFARVKGKPGFCLATSGPGATNLITGIADAFMDSVPMVAITGQVPRHLIGTDAFQETDITGICMAITKKTYLLNDLHKAPEVFCDAYKTSMLGRPGPVLVDIPKNVQVQEIELDEDWDTRFVPPRIERIFNSTPEEISKAAALIANAKKPLVIAGHGNLISDSWQELRNFVRREQIPVISTVLGIGIMPVDDPLYFSWLGMHGMKYANMAVQECDLIIALGIRFDDRITGKLDTFAPNAKILHIDIDKSEYGKNVATEVFLHADLKLALQQIPLTASEDNLPQRRAWLQYLEQLRQQYPLMPANYEKFTEVCAIKLLDDYIPDTAIVTTDVGQHQMWAAQYLSKLQPNHFLTSGGLGTMGFGLPAAFGAQVAAPQNEVWCISGDGSFQMNLQELITCVDEKRAVKILLLDNEYLGMVRQWQSRFYDKNYSGVKLRNPDFVKLAEAYGLEAAVANNQDELREALQKAQNAPGPFLIHARVLREEDVLPMVAPGASLSDTIYYPTEQAVAQS